MTAAVQESPSRELYPDLCVIGAGPGGLSVALAAAQLGVSVVLIEKHKMGGSSLNNGSIPSKALLAAANRAQAMRTATSFGLGATRPAVDQRAIRAHIEGVVAALAPNCSVERLTGLNVKVITAAAQFVDRRTVRAGDYRIRARRFVIATGSVPAIPPIAGLGGIPYLTNETIFDCREKIDHLIVIGGGSNALELGQAFLRLGSRVTVLEALKALGKDDPEASDIVLKQLRAEGLDILEGVLVERVTGEANRIDVRIDQNGASRTIQGTHLLVATGRVPNVSGLNLEAARIKYDKRGIQVDKTLATSNSRVFAIGDVTGGPPFSHVAHYHAGIVIRRAVFRLPAKVDTGIIPWTTFTDPELAHIGLSEDGARKRYDKVQVFRWPFYENDKACLAHTAEGFVKVIADAKGAILGASIIGPQAGELIQMWSLAISEGLNIKAMTRWISPYPALSEVNQKVAYEAYATVATSPLVRRLIGWLARLG
jgi:pyruvate/2-oxoglutarate dehydrogenase complex dihydrolipoamide dehydrogenase (E3) component